MQEEVILLQEFILESPAPTSEHARQVGRLRKITGAYEKEINRLKAEIKGLKEESED